MIHGDEHRQQKLALGPRGNRVQTLAPLRPPTPEAAEFDPAGDTEGHASANQMAYAVMRFCYISLQGKVDWRPRDPLMEKVAGSVLGFLYAYIAGDLPKENLVTLTGPAQFQIQSIEVQEPSSRPGSDRSPRKRPSKMTVEDLTAMPLPLVDREGKARGSKGEVGSRSEQLSTKGEAQAKNIRNSLP